MSHHLTGQPRLRMEAWWCEVLTEPIVTQHSENWRTWPHGNTGWGERRFIVVNTQIIVYSCITIY